MEEQSINPNLNNNEINQVTTDLIRRIDGLEKRLVEYQNNKILEELQLPKDVIEQSGLLEEQPDRLKRGRGARPLLESEIKDAQEHSDTASGCARYLRVNYKTYKKWAVRYGLFKVNPWGKDCKKKYWAPDKGKYPLNQILDGKFPNYPVFRLKDLLIRSGTKKAECERCGHNERRPLDNKMCILLSFKDGNQKNHLLENIEVLCYNCSFHTGRGYIRSGRVKRSYCDPDRMQGSSKKIEARF